MLVSNPRKICIRLLIISASILLACYFGIILFKDVFVDFVLLNLPINVVFGYITGLILTCVVMTLLLMSYPNKSQVQSIEVK
jgi:hypothetical protein